MATQDQNFGAAYVDECIHCIADLERFAERCVQDPLLGANVFKNGSWELFDKVYAMSDDHSISSKQQTIMLDLVGHICDHARPREVVLMVLEKISGCTDVFPFLLLLHAMLHIITKSDSTSMWNQGKIPIALFESFAFTTESKWTLTNPYLLQGSMPFVESPECSQILFSLSQKLKLRTVMMKKRVTVLLTAKHANWRTADVNL